MQHNYPVEIFTDYEDFKREARKYMTEQEVGEAVNSSDSLGLPRPIFARDDYVIVYASRGVYALMRKIPFTGLGEAKAEMSSMFDKIVFPRQEASEY